MSEWNRNRDEGQRRYGYEDSDRGGRRQDGGRNETAQRSFGSRGGDWSSYEGYPYGGERYGGYERSEDSYSRSGQSYGGQSYGGQSYGRSGGRRYDERDQEGLAYYGLGPFGTGRHPGEAQYRSGPSYGDRQYGGGQQRDRQAYSQGGAVGENERLQRVSDGETDRGHFFGGGMARGGEHRGRGPKNYTRSDDRIREDVNDRLSDDAWLDASEIDVAVNACEVTLTGTVNSREDKRRAEDLVEDVSGVKHVQNNLRVQAVSSQASTNQATTNQTATPAQRSGGQTGSLQ